MNPLLQFLVAHGAVLLTGASVLLTLGATFMLVQRSPIHRQRLGEITVLATLLWLVLTSLPLPRLSLERASAPDGGRAADLPLHELTDAGAFADAAFIEPMTPIEALPPEHADVPPDIADATTGLIESSPQPTIPASTAVAVPADPVDWARAAAIAYVSGVAACTGWMVLGHVLLRRLIRSARLPEPWLGELFARLDPPGSVRLLVSDTASRPISCGLFRATIILPRQCVGSDKAQQLGQVLRHELAHVTQRDCLGHALFNLALPVLYFHPVYWLIRAKTFLARELVADDRAAAATSKESYVSELIALAAQRLTPHAAARLNVIGIFESTTHFYRRMHMLLQRQTPLATRCSTLWRCFTAMTALVILGCSTLFIGVDRAHAQAAPQDRNQEIAALTAQRDDLAAKLAQMELQLNQLRAQVEALRAQGLEQKQIEMRIRDASKVVEKAREEEAVAGPERNAIRRRAELQREQARQQREQLAGEAGQPAGGAANPLEPQQGGRSTSGARGQSSQLDLISLANSYIEASGNRKLRQLQLQRVQRLAESKAVSQEEHEMAMIEMEMAERKARLFRGMAEAALRGAEGEYKHARELVEKGLAPASAVHDAESRLHVLKLILEN